MTDLPAWWPSTTPWIIADCREIIDKLPDNSVDLILTDPPYGLNLMGKDWDKAVPGVDYWKRMIRIAKPGAHLLSFGGTRTFHRLACAIEDSGWDLRDCIVYCYGSGFPKSRNVEMAIKEEFGTEDAKTWKGFATALKPSWEPVLIFRKPIEGTVAANVLKYGTGALNIDECRVPADKEIHGGGGMCGLTDGWDRPWKHDPEAVAARKERADEAIEKANTLGRWPANLIHDGSKEIPTEARRFFYCAKPSNSERSDNTHPTIKPLKLLEYLIKLTTRKNYIVLDPFLGSGSTLEACANTQRIGLGIELNAENEVNIRKRSRIDVPKIEDFFERPTIQRFFG